MAVASRLTSVPSLPAPPPLSFPPGPFPSRFHLSLPVHSLPVESSLRPPGPFPPQFNLPSGPPGPRSTAVPGLPPGSPRSQVDGCPSPPAPSVRLTRPFRSQGDLTLPRPHPFPWRPDPTDPAPPPSYQKTRRDGAESKCAAGMVWGRGGNRRAGPSKAAGCSSMTLSSTPWERRRWSASSGTLPPLPLPLFGV